MMMINSVHHCRDSGSSHNEKKKKGFGLYNVGLWKLKVLKCGWPLEVHAMKKKNTKGNLPCSSAFLHLL